MRWLVEALTVFDWITPVIETGKDVNHALFSNEATNHVKLSSRNEKEFRRLCQQLGVTVVSKAGAPFRDMIITVGDLSKSDIEVILSSGLVKDFAGRATR